MNFTEHFVSIDALNLGIIEEIDTFSSIYYVSKLNQKDKNSLNRYIIISNIDAIVNFSKNTQSRTR